MQLPDEKVFCHRTGFQELCFDMVVKKKCGLWIEILGEHPQTGAAISRHVCADAVMPLLAIQGNQLQGQTTASVDKVANEVQKHREETVTVGAMSVQRSRDAIKETIERNVQRLTAEADAPKLIGQG